MELNDVMESNGDFMNDFGSAKNLEPAKIQPEVEVGLRSKRACKNLCQELGYNWYHPEIPSGYVKIAIENGHRNSGFSH